MDATGVAGLINVNQVEPQAARKTAAGEIETTRANETAPETAPSATARARMEVYTKMVLEGAGQLTADGQSAPGTLDNTAYKLIGQHPIFPFDKNFMDVFNEFVKRSVSGEVEITNKTLAPAKEQIEQVKANIGTEKPVSEEDPKETAPRDISDVI